MKPNLFLIFILNIITLLNFRHSEANEETFLLIHGNTNTIVSQLGPQHDVRFSPCSSFKIVLSLMGYDAGVLIDETSPAWEYQTGYDDYLDSWKTTLTPATWMQYSCLWYSKMIALQLGEEKINHYLKAFNYGNQNLSAGLTPLGPKNPAWINSSLQISPREQVQFLHKIIVGNLPVSAEALRHTRAILFKETLGNGWNLFGKTGWSGADITQDGITLQHSWFVGWIEKEDDYYPFAYLIRAPQINLEARIPRVKTLISEICHLDEL